MGKMNKNCTKHTINHREGRGEEKGGRETKNPSTKNRKNKLKTFAENFLSQEAKGSPTSARRKAVRVRIVG